MAKKRRKPDRRKAKRGQRSPELPDIPDQRAMEGRMWGIFGRAAGDSPLDQAQQIMYQAFEQRDERYKLDLAKQALTLCPDCADAYVLLAEHAGNHNDALELYRKGVEAGERTLGPQVFQENVGHFWGVLETRPYMRARLGLANELWSAGRRAEAVPHLQDLLRLNPHDNQGVRYTLAGYLLYLDRDEDVASLLQQFTEEASASWAYTRTLLAFRQGGDTPHARQCLEAAKKSNRYVPAFLLGKKHLSAEQPPYYSPGQESEAMVYAQMFLRCWRNTSGALTWLRQAEKSERKQIQPKAPLGFIKSWLTRNLLPSTDTWLADFRQLPDWIVIAGDKVRPWTILVTNAANGPVLAHAIVEESPSANHLWDTLLQAMQKPIAGQPHRPAQVQGRPDECWTILKPHLAEIGVELVLTDKLGEMDRVFDDLHQHLLGRLRPGMLDVPGVCPEHVGEFFEAAARFYQQAPWKTVGDDATIKVECEKFESGPWYAVVMGQSGLTLGLALYEDLRIVRKTQAGQLDDEDHARHAVVLSMTYGEETDLTGKDVEAVQEYGWKLAGPEAYPSLFKKERGMALRPPLSWELELMTGCLRAVPEFVNRRQQDGPAKEEITVPVASGSLRLVLAWVSNAKNG